MISNVLAKIRRVQNGPIYPFPPLPEIQQLLASLNVRLLFIVHGALGQRILYLSNTHPCIAEYQ
jgi:hypothetical protein